MTFRVKKIRSGPIRPRNKYISRLLRNLGVRGTIIAGVMLFFVTVFAVGAMVIDSGDKSPSRGGLFSSFNPLQKDKYGHTNFLFLGVAGDAKEGGNLSDSIMIASINPNGPSASFLSLPRDLFIASEVGDRKVNEIYATARYKHGDEEGLRVIKEALSKFTGVDIHYGAVINFSAFEEMVDAMGGIDIYVPQDIVDPYYPDGNYGFTTFVVRKGMQHLDGKTALRYARSRKTSSDYDRARRQQDLILALKSKASEKSLLTDFGELKKFYNIFKNNINTDVGISEVIALAKVGISIDYSNSVTAVLNDDPEKKDGFLYTPAREFYAGQFVLLPYDLRDTQLFMQLILVRPEILLEKAQIEVLNGSRIQGKASETGKRLRRFGFHVISTGNHESDMPVFRSWVKNLGGEKTQATAKLLSELLDAEYIPTKLEDVQARETAAPEERLIDVQVVLGAT